MLSNTYNTGSTQQGIYFVRRSTVCQNREDSGFVILPFIGISFEKPVFRWIEIVMRNQSSFLISVRFSFMTIVEGINHVLTIPVEYSHGSKFFTTVFFMT